MRIQDGQLSGVGTPATGGSQQVKPVSPEQTSATKSQQVGDGIDQVELSGLAGKVSAGSVGSDARSARVAELTKLVQSGQYNPSPDKIADAMIDEMSAGSANLG